MKNKLSILIPSIESRRALLSDLVCDLIKQCGIIKSVKSFTQEGCIILIIGFENVEIIVATDNKEISTGTKRNLLLSIASNHYSVQIDDDDWVYPYYIEEVLKAIQYDTDCIGTRGIITTNGEQEIEWRLSKDYPNETIVEDGKSVYLRTTNHISIVKTELALKAGFSDKSNAEDKDFSMALNPYLKSEIKIDKLMYHYRFQNFNKEYV